MCVAQSKLVIEKGEEDTNLNRLKKKIHRVAEKKKKKRPRSPEACRYRKRSTPAVKRVCMFLCNGFLFSPPAPSRPKADEGEKPKSFTSQLV